MGDVLPFRKKSFLPDGATVLTMSLHYDPVMGLHWIKKRNPGCRILMSVAKPTNDDRLVTIQHIAVDGEMTGEEAVEMLGLMPAGASIAWRRI